MYELPRFPGADRLTNAERQAFVSQAIGAGYDPAGIGAVMQLESGWSMSIHGPKVFDKPPGYPVGLIQFSPDTAESLGTSTSELERMPFGEQIQYVLAYYDRFGGPAAFRDPGDYYLAGWGASPRTDDSKQLSTSGSPSYTGNRGLDTNADGTIKAAELRALIHRTIANAMARGTWSIDDTAPPQVVSSKSSRAAGTIASLAIGAAVIWMFVATLRPGKRRRLGAI